MKIDEIIKDLREFSDTGAIEYGYEMPLSEVREVLKALERTRWIPVSERLPTEDDADKLTGLVLFKRSNGWIHTDYWVAAQDLKDTNTHWMPLPEPPREVES